MKYRKLGETGISVSEIGFGAWGIGGLSNGATSYGKTSDAESKKALRRAFEKGITFFDTSDLYGYGHSEQLIGETLKDVREKIAIASKAGFLEHNGPQDFSSKHIKASAEKSLRRLQTDYLDLYQLHSPAMDLLKEGGAIEALQDLKREGKIRAFGISARSPGDGLAALKLGFQSIQTNFSLVDQRALECGLLGACRAQGVGVICRTPLCFGFLAGNYANMEFDSRDHRSSWPPEQRDLWANAYKTFLLAVKKNGDQTNAQFALRYCLSYPAVSSTIPGMLTSAEVDENIGASELPPFSETELAKLQGTYGDHSFFIKKPGTTKAGA